MTPACFATPRLRGNRCALLAALPAAAQERTIKIYASARRGRGPHLRLNSEAR